MQNHLGPIETLHKGYRKIHVALTFSDGGMDELPKFMRSFWATYDLRKSYVKRAMEKKSRMFSRNNDVWIILSVQSETLEVTELLNFSNF